ncbi:MAG TPA: L,D-transpeptidase [Ramlibacter sp.]|uniref:L,D-transpeptidase n=1 Tax=Ramlibacter sp. TaxID=1917967 RepID=UPI002D7E151B|nr:L,D-transpeptidase [Ramlibacter sp.]HET8745377.1 L,D-transpeptidase [Ramlibacter sp.]
MDARRWLRKAAGSTAWWLVAALAPAAGATESFQAAGASQDARSLVGWVQRSGDAHGRPYAVVDKRGAHIYVFHADGRLAGHSPALLGSAVGDHTAPNVGAHAQTGHVPPAERTTPAGRFEAVPGENRSGEQVIWVDYESAFAIHRLRPGFSYAARSGRLATAKVDGKRVSWGCVVVPVAFYKQVVQRVLGASRSVVYVLPETRPVQGFMQALEKG